MSSSSREKEKKFAVHRNQTLEYCFTKRKRRLGEYNNSKNKEVSNKMKVSFFRTENPL